MDRAGAVAYEHEKRCSTETFVPRARTGSTGTGLAKAVHTEAEAAIPDRTEICVTEARMLGSNGMMASALSEGVKGFQSLAVEGGNE